MPPTPQTPRASSLWRSFGHAWDGLVAAAAGQRNMRIHVVAGVLAGTFAAVAPLAAVERALVLLCVVAVIAAEAANTALEAVVDLLGGPPSELGRIAKDAAAGAVLVLAGGSVATFALLAAAHWRALWAGRHATWPPAAAGAGLAVLAALLLFRGRPFGRPAAAVAAAGVGLLGVLIATSACRGCATVPAVLLALAWSSGSRASGGSGATVGV